MVQIIEPRHGYSIVSSDRKFAGKLEGYPLGDDLGPVSVTEGGSSDGVSVRNLVGKLEDISEEIKWW